MTKPHSPSLPETFSYIVTKSGSVLIQQNGNTVKTLKDKTADKFLMRVQSVTPVAAQLLMAKITGQFKFGNERTGKLAQARHDDSVIN